jgi:hypothetical protein
LIRAAAGLALASVAAAAFAAPAPSRPSAPAPAGWKAEASVTGDLTGDGLPDVAVVWRRTDPARVIANSGLGEPTIDTNPRRLAVFERLATGALRQIATTDSLVPPAGSEDTPCLADPLDEGGIAIAGGVLEVRLQYWLSCGSYGVTGTAFKFRREDARMRLIGFDRREFMRSSGEGEETSFNYLTGRKGRRGFSIESDRKRPWRWSRFTPQALYLNTIDLGACPQADAETPMC